MDDQLIQQAKEFANKNNKSVSRVVADYFRSLGQPQTINEQLPPVTQSLVGILSNTHLSEDDYKQHLERKYL